MNQPLSPFEKRQLQKQRIAARRRVRMRRRIFSAAVLLLVLMVVVTAAVFVVRSIDWDGLLGKQKAAPGPTSDGNVLYGPELSYFDPLEATTDYVTVSRDAIFQGELILVNPDTPFHFELWEEPVSVFDYKSSSYSVRSKNIKLSRATIDALNDFLDAFSQATGIGDLMVNSAYRSKEEQQEVWDDYMRDYGEEYTKKYVSVPGYSEHHSGLALDLAIYNSRGIAAVRDEGNYAWLYDHMAEYGFILRYPKGKETETGISFESWHFRYVTVPHAIFMQSQNYTMEYYLENIRIYTYEGVHAKVASPDGTQYGIYFYQADDAAEQQVPVPKNTEYTILGNNSDGFLISYRIPSEAE